MSDHDWASLEALGLGATAQQVYRCLFSHGGRTAAQVIGATQLSARQVRAVLASLEARGLVARTGSRPQRFVPAQPDAALELLILQRREQLERTRMLANGLQETFRALSEDTGAADLVEVVSGRDAYAQRYLQLQGSATRELMGFNHPPYVAMPAQCTDQALDALATGVRYRTIYSRAALEYEGQLQAACEGAAAGEEVRTLSEVPLKLAIADRRWAILPLTLAPGRERGVVVHRSSLLDALITLFETLWAQAAPLRFAAVDGAAEAGRRRTDTDEAIVALLTAGLRDDAIAHQLGLGLSTVHRRVKRIMDAVGADTRFQAGMLLAQRQADRDGGA